MDYDELFKRREFSSALASSGYTHGRELIIYKEKDQGSTVAVGFKTQGRSILTKTEYPKESKDTSAVPIVVAKAPNGATSTRYTSVQKKHEYYLMKIKPLRTLKDRKMTVKRVN